MEINKLIDFSNEKTNKAYSAIKNGNSYNELEDDINFIFDCAFDKRKAVWEYCSRNIFQLSEISNDIKKRIIEIMENGNAHKKFIIICTLYKMQDMEFFKKIIYLAIKDKSKKIKLFGVQKANSYSIYEFSDIIKEEFEKTNDSVLRENMKTNYVYLTRGYIVEKSDSELGNWLSINHSAARIPKEMTTEEIHEYVIIKYKDNDRIKDLYYK